MAASETAGSRAGSWERMVAILGGALSIPGGWLGVLFFAASLTPSLIPRTPLAQGALSGACMAVGYGLGVGLCLLWRFLGLPASPPWLRWSWWVVSITALVAALALWRAAHWQDMVRRAVGLPAGHGAGLLEIAMASVVVFLLLLAAARAFRAVVRMASAWTAKRLPRRIAVAIGFIGTTLLVVLLANGVVLRFALHAMDSSFRQADALIPPGTQPPREAGRTGGPGSLIAWDELGSAGRDFVSSTPAAESIARFTRRPAMAPLRVYAGLPAAGTACERADLALAELRRAGGFSRRALVVVTPTGTGWIDPAAIEPIEYLYRGDVASVAVQYSYLSSPLSLLVEPEYGEETARALFQAVYGYWRTLPRDRRPKLYLHGLSLGALNSERSIDLFELLGDPVDGALWSGPPFASRRWREITGDRNPGSPAWLPRFRDDAFVRFMNQDGTAVPAGTPWGAMRVVYLQYASDAVTFFDYRNAFRAHAWMASPRGPDVAPGMRWYPLVTMLQLALDMPMADGAPMGHGHVFAPSHYTEAWLEVTGIDDWSREDIERLERHLDVRRRASLEEDAGSG